jgi:hypothetical protein
MRLYRYECSVFVNTVAQNNPIFHARPYAPARCGLARPQPSEFACRTKPSAGAGQVPHRRLVAKNRSSAGAGLRRPRARETLGRSAESAGQ